MFSTKLKVNFISWILYPLFKALDCYLVIWILLHAIVANNSISIHNLGSVDLAKDRIVCEPGELKRVQAARRYEPWDPVDHVTLVWLLTWHTDYRAELCRVGVFAPIHLSDGEALG